MKSRILKWGNSLALRIPKSFAVKAGLKNGSAVEISLQDGKIVVTPDSKPDISLEKLLAGGSHVYRKTNSG